MVAQTFSKWCLIADFQVNRDYIAKNLCVNRFKPCCCCKGKCYLNKKMAADESQQQTPGKGGQRDETVLLAHRPAFTLPGPAVTPHDVIHATRYIADHPQGYNTTPFEPPRRTSVFC
jgi:hypothetical protein